MSGGKGGSSTSTVQIPEYIEKAAQRNLNKAEQISQIGYTPYYGPDVAAFTPTQQAAFQNTSNMAGAFGMAAPTSTGMPQATDFGGGLMGYSSAPLYENAVSQLRRNRPGQYNAITGMFIDPRTGAAPSAPTIDYTAYDTAAQAAARQADLDRQNQLAIAREGRGGDNYYYSGTVVDNGASAGGGDGASYGFGNAMSDLSVDLGGSGFGAAAKGMWGNDGGTYDSDRGGDGGGGGDKVICTALHSLGLLPDDIYALDAQFGQRVNREDPALGDGYRLWATPIAEYIKGDSIGSKIALAVVKPLATAWAKQMAHTMRPDEYKPNLAGKALMAVGHPTCRLIGNVFARQIAATKEA